MAIGYPPGYEPPEAPGIFGSTAMGMGMGAPYGMQQQYAQMGAQMGSLQAGAAPVNALANWAWPVGVTAFSMGSFTVAPMMAKGAMTGLGRGVGRAWGMADPFRWAGVTAKPAWQFGRGAMGLSGAGFGGTISSTVGGGWSAGMARAGMAGAVRGGLGGAMRLGAAAGMAGAAALPPLAAGMLATEAVIGTGHQVWKGAQQDIQGQALMAQLGPSVAPGQNISRNQSGAAYQMMTDLGQDIGKSGEEMGRMAQEMNRQGLFKSTRSVKEFRARFKEVLGAVKEISQTMQTTIDDAMQTFGELRQQGFYTTSDIKTQALKDKTREMSSGISAGQLEAVGQYGAQAARSMGMRGRFGADLTKQSVTAVQQALRQGTMSEEDVTEMGGVEAVGARLATRQMRFMQSSRGRAMIAYSMGAGGAPDPGRLGRMLGGGMSMEGLVTGAAGRGLGVLGAAGGREAREEFAPYAGMAMISMAAMQHQQLYGGRANERQLSRMLGTMGVGRDEARLRMQQAAAMPETMRQQRGAEEYLYQQRQALEPGSQISAFAGRAWRGAVTDPLQGIGRGMSRDFQDAYQTGTEALGMGGPREYTLTQESLAEYRSYMAQGGEATTGLSGEDMSGTQVGRGLAAGRQDFGHAEARRRRQRGEKVIELGGGRFTTQAGATEQRRRLGERAQRPGGGGLGEWQTARLERAARQGFVGGGRGEAPMSMIDLQATRAAREGVGLLRGGLGVAGGFVGMAFGGGLLAAPGALGGMRLGEELQDLAHTKLDEIEDRQTFRLAKGIKAVDQSMTFEQFRQGDRSERLREDINKAMPGLFGDTRGSLGVMSSEQLRKEVKSSTWRMLGVGAAFGTSTPEINALAKEVQGNAKSRAALKRYMEVLKTELEKDQPDEAKLNNAFKEAEQELGEGSDAADALKGLERGITNMSDKERNEYFEKDGVYDAALNAYGELATREHLGKRFGAERMRIDKFMASKQAAGLSDSQRRIIKDIRTTVSGDVSRENALQHSKLYAEFARDALLSMDKRGERVSAQEAEAFAGVGGAGAVAFLRGVEGAAKGDVKLEDLGFSEEDAASLTKGMKGMSESERIEKITAGMAEAGIVPTDVSQKGEKTIEGTLTEFADANTRFVDAVHKFTTFFPTARLLSTIGDEDPKLEPPE